MIGPILLLIASTGAVGDAVANRADADDRSAKSGTLIGQLGDCRAIRADAERLACFDRTVGAVVDAQRKSDIVILDRSEVRKAKRSLFGFSLPSIELFGGGKDDEAMKQLVATMRSTTPLPGGLIRFELDDGGLWETTEQVMLAPRRGDVVTIKAGALGSYVATSPGRRSARVRRLR
ncbi:hypothetical protein VH567_02925 [Sphingomonas sp. 4RDLI-65]|uniref:hypothetical protein n=1 Tax=Sphingomonas sp. 4RDLI-65 TaxID=3111641 RepID=UPI003C146634